MSRESESMKRLRKERKEAGLVEYRLWCKPVEKRQHERLSTGKFKLVSK